MAIATVIGFIAGTLTTFSFVPQVLKTFRSKRCDDLSWGMLLAFTGGVCLWFVYGVFFAVSAYHAGQSRHAAVASLARGDEGPLPPRRDPMIRSTAAGFTNCPDALLAVDCGGYV